MSDRELKNFLKLSLVRGIGYKFLREFYDTFGSFEGDFLSNLKRFLKEKVSPKRVEEILKLIREDKNFSLVWEFIQQFRVEIIPFFDPRFPTDLEKLGITFPALYVLGELNPNGFSIVGTRKASAEGRLKAREFAKALAGEGYTVISGGAEGIDRNAHEGALSVGGKTGIVLGEGLATFLRRNRLFAERVLKNGGFLISQFPPFTIGAKWTYPLRNSLIAYFGIYGTLIVEAPTKSGALITADYALKLKRPLFVYLNCVKNPLYGGNLKLLKECKAKLITETGEIFQHIKEKGTLQPKSHKRNTVKEQSLKGKSEDILQKLLMEKPRTFDELVALSSFSEEQLLETLTLLELEGKVSLEGGFYRWIG